MVNDGSTDNTVNIVNSYPVKLINLKNNQGTLFALKTGVENATYDVITFVGCKMMLPTNYLKTINEINYIPLSGIVANERENKYLSQIHTFLFLTRKKIKKYYPIKDYTEDYLMMDFNDFETPLAVGSGGFTCEKEDWLNALPDVINKFTHNDTKILKQIAKRKSIMVHTKLEFSYDQYTDMTSELKHVHNRGQTFADYYLAKGSKYNSIFYLLLLLNIVLSVFGLLSINFLIQYFVSLFIVYVLVCIYLSENIRDFIIMLLYLPPFMMSFTTGILKYKLFHS